MFIIFSGSSKQSQFSTVWWVQCGVRSLSAGQGADECIHSTLNLSIEDTIGTHLAVLYKKVSLIQSYICTQLYVVGTADSVLIREVVFIQRFHCIAYFFSQPSCVMTLAHLSMGVVPSPPHSWEGV